MCTAINICSHHDSYFIRNLDLDYDICPKIIVTPRFYSIKFKNIDPILSHYSIVGLGIEQNSYPLYFDAMNEKGLSFAGLNFPILAAYHIIDKNKLNLAPYELPLYLLSKCATINEVLYELESINIIDAPFSKELKLTPLHFIISHEDTSIVIESTTKGLRVYHNSLNVLTNSPDFKYMKFYVSNFMSITDKDPVNNISPNDLLLTYSNGLGAFGLPGDYSSTSRFVRAFYNKSRFVKSKNNLENISNLFNLASSVAMPKGAVTTSNGLEYTRYSVIYNATRGNLYYKTYENPNISKFIFHPYENLDKLITYELNRKFEIFNSN